MAHIIGTSGDDILQQNSGEDDIIDGGAGFDVLDLMAVGAGVSVNLNNQNAQQFAPGEGLDRLISIEGVAGTAFNDVLIAHADGSYLIGFGGADTLVGRESSDSLAGGDDNDILIGRGGADQLRGEAGDDLLRPGTSENGFITHIDFVDGGDGIDTVDFSYDVSSNVAANGIRVSLQTGDATSGGGLYATIRNVENVTGTNAGDILGGDADDNILRGLDGDDFLNGSDGNNKVYGGDGDDQVSALSGSNMLYGEAGDDYVTGGTGNDKLYGGDGNDQLGDTGGDDSFYGGAGNDSFYDVKGTNLLHGGADIDIFYAGLLSGTGAVISLASKVAYDIGQTKFHNRLIDFEGAVGSQWDDTIIGNDGVNELSGSGGDDVIDGGSENDILNGGDGDDFIRSVAVGVSGKDDNLVDGGNGIDTVDYSRFDDGSTTGVIALMADGVVYDGLSGGRVMMDTIISIEKVFGTDQNDQMNAFGFDGAATFKGNGGDDILSGGVHGDTLIGDDGDDTLTGNEGDDVLIGGAGEDQLFGGEGDDLLRPGFVDGAYQNFDGGAGFDTLDASGYINGHDNTLGVQVVASLGIEVSQRGTGTILGEGDEFSSIEQVIGTSSNDTLSNGDTTGITFQGKDGDDTLNGSTSAADVLLGGNGDDLIFGAHRIGDIGNFIDGGAGRDVLAYNNFEDVATTTGLHIRATTSGGGSTSHRGNPGVVLDTFRGIESIHASDYADIIELNAMSASHYSVRAGDGGDHIYGSDGDEIIFAGNGNDTIISGLGEDTILGEDGDDFIRIDLDTSGYDQVSGGLGTDTVDLGSFDQFFFFMANYGLKVTMTDGVNAAGDVQVNNGMVSDTLLNFDSIEQFAGTAGRDAFDMRFALMDLYVDGKGDNDLIQTGLGNDALLGRDGDDRLEAGPGNDQIGGFDGDDTIVGGQGNDIMYGGAGNDTFLYDNASPFGEDDIMDFVGGAGSDDLIDLTGTGATNVIFGSLNGDKIFLNVMSGANLLGNIYLPNTLFVDFDQANDVIW